MKRIKTSLWIIVLAFAVALGVAVLEAIPWRPTWSWHALYVIPVVWIALWSVEDDLFLLPAMAVVVTGLALLHLVFPLGPMEPDPLSDRIVVLFVIWSTVLIALLRKRARRTFKWIDLSTKQR